MREEILKALNAIMNSEKANTIGLSKGGWEGWLQCELWEHLSIEQEISVERELHYPNEKSKCDLVITGNEEHRQLWIEIKAPGIFREGKEAEFLKGIELDAVKLDNLRPSNTKGLSLIVIPKSISESFENIITERRWTGLTKIDYEYTVVYYIKYQ